MFYRIIKAILNVFIHLCFRIRTVGADNVINTGGAIIAVNHRSNWDPVIVGTMTKRKINFMAKSELFAGGLASRGLKLLGAFPIERGKGDISAIKNSLRIITGGELLLIFPEGRRTTDEGGERAKTGMIMMAHRARVPIIPVYISGKYRWFARVTVSYGTPIELSKYYGERLTPDMMQSLADDVMAKIRGLKV